MEPVSEGRSTVARSDAGDTTPACRCISSVSPRCCSPGRASLVVLVIGAVLPRWSVLRSFATNLVARRRDRPPHLHHSRQWCRHPRSVERQAISTQTTCTRSRRRQYWDARAGRCRRGRLTARRRDHGRRRWRPRGGGTEPGDRLLMFGATAARTALKRRPVCWTPLAC